MSIDLDDEIVQDFLVEAGEILDRLSSELVDLETSPDDMDLLNSVFRGFHTIKGGAGFLALDNMVVIAHKAEDIFDLLRQVKRQADAELMDSILLVLDVLNEMFDSLRGGEEPQAADPGLVETLKKLADPDYVGSETDETVAEAEPVAEAAAEPDPEPESEPAAEADAQTVGGDDITDEEFENLLDAISSEKAAGKVAAGADKPADDLIDDEEFENLLDELHGKGKHSNAPEQAAAKTGSDDITEDEFEALLDEIHGKGKSGDGAGQQTEQKQAAPKGDDITEDEFDALLDEIHGKGKQTAKPAAKPAAKVESKPAETAAKEKDVAPVAATEKKAAAAGGKAKPVPAAESTVRVETSVLDEIMNMVGELVLIRNRLSTLEVSIGDEEMTKTVSTLDIVTSDLQTAAMKTRMQPIKKVFGRFPRVVRDLARTLKKEIVLEMSGEDTDLDKNLVEALADPLVHLVRNSVDHGIEMPDIREAAGKPRTGTIKLSAETEGDHILLMIQDDGAGMDADMLRRKAVEKGLMDEDAAGRLSNRECYELIFMAGFSTKVEVSDISGRGVGMDVVKTRISQLNGIVEIDSTKGVGTTLSIKLPLTLAIMPTLMVVLGQQIFALPLVNVNEIIDFRSDKESIVDGQKVLLVRDKALPLFYLGNWLVNGNPDSNKGAHVVIVNIGTQRVGLLVDQLIGQEEVVIKPLGAMLQGTSGLSGATITGDGRIALILDLPSLVQHYA